MASSPQQKKKLFLVVTVLCFAVAVIYTLFSARSAHREATDTIASPQPQATHVPPSPEAAVPEPTQEKRPSPELQAKTPANPPKGAVAPEKLSKSITSKGRLIALNMRDSPNLGKVEYAPLDEIEPDQRTAVDLRCERIYFAAGEGICLRREVHILTAQTVATVLDASFQPRFTIRNDGIPSRARISPDGRYAAFTVFLTGHSYGDAQLATATLLVDMQHGTTIANLEDFQVLQDGNVIKSPDFNYWGVTFQRDSNFFYATLRTKGVNYLVHGDIKARTITVIYKGVECPSLSPDGKRVAFKKLISRNNWRLSVLDLATLQETPLAETKSVDDQAEWLDNHHVLYALVDGAPWMSVMVVPADGSGQPQIFAKGATSPAVVR
jgi:Tol biopolymer transport system component